MLRLLALPVALASVLASAGCAAAGLESGPTAPRTAPTASTAAAEPTSPAPEGSSEASGTRAPDASQPASSTAPPSGLIDAQQTPDGDQGTPGLPEGSGASVDDVLRLGAVATWVERPSLIALSLPASSTCWISVGAPVAESTTRIAVDVDVPISCVAPDDARTYRIAVPAGIDASAEVQLAVIGLGAELTLPLPGR